jgi:hypothetical protein
MPGFHTYEQLRQAEDVQDMIYIVSPVDAPVASMSKTIRATGKLHEWTEDKLLAAGPNKHVEGAAAPADVSAPVTERSNYCQIMSKRAEITGTLEDVDKYGRTSEMSYQLELRYSEMANDEELAIMGKPGGTRQTGDAGSSSTAREMASLISQLDAGVTVDGTTYTTVAHLEDGILAAHLATYDLGGNPSYLITNPANAQYIANFAYAAGRSREIHNGSDDRKLVNVIDLLVNPYGELDVILDRHADDSMTLLDFNYLATPVLRPTTDWPLAKTGDSENRQILRESTYAVLNSEAHAVVVNIPTNLTVS